MAHRGPPAKYVGAQMFWLICVYYFIYYECNDARNCTERAITIWCMQLPTPTWIYQKNLSLFSIILMPPACPLSTGSRPTVQYLSSLCELPQALQPYYTQGYVLAALHPIILSVGRTRSLACSLLYRAILARPRPR